MQHDGHKFTRSPVRYSEIVHDVEEVKKQQCNRKVDLDDGPIVPDFFANYKQYCHDHRKAEDRKTLRNVGQDLQETSDVTIHRKPRCDLRNRLKLKANNDGLYSL